MGIGLRDLAGWGSAGLDATCARTAGRRPFVLSP
jgi:hypothetical protein